MSDISDWLREAFKTLWRWIRRLFGASRDANLKRVDDEEGDEEERRKEQEDKDKDHLYR